MSRGPRSEALEPGPGDWRPTASLKNLRRRAELLACLREFFAERGVLEVETPLMASATVTDLHLASFHVSDPAYYLQTSPEFAMKRLLASGSGPIYQICKAFRRDEAGRFHNPEFTMLEWYRPGWDHHALMDEMDALLARALSDHPEHAPPAERATYAELFKRHLGGDAHGDTPEQLARLAKEQGIDVIASDGMDRDTWLHLLWSHVVEPKLGRGCPTFVLDFPASQAALARIRPATDQAPAVAERFEVYVEGVELANGFHELADGAEQRRRFEEDLAERQRRGLSTPPMDERLLAALDSGFPDCAGVALGFDRLLMLATGAGHLAEVIAFPFDRA